MGLVTIQRRLNKPYFVFRARQAARTIRGVTDGDGGPYPDVVLPCGFRLGFRRRKQTSVGILRRGLFDVVISETLYRLTDPGDPALDVGGNVGHMTSVLVSRVGRGGEVLTFEPHPRIVENLRFNVERWAARARCCRRSSLVGRSTA